MYEVRHAGIFSKSLLKQAPFLGSQAVNLMSQGQIVAIGEDLHYSWQIRFCDSGKFALT